MNLQALLITPLHLQLTLVNDFIFYYEKGFRANKFGIPGGVFSSTPLPEKVEDYYSKSNSRHIIRSF